MTTNIPPLIGGLAILACIAAVGVLTWHGNITGEAAMGFFSIVLGIVSSAAVSHIATKTGAKAAGQKFD